MADFIGQVIAGLAVGSIYSLLALALCVIHRTTNIVNFAQGEFATLTTFIAYSLITSVGFAFWPAFAATLVIAFIIGALVERVFIRPVENASPATAIIMTLALFVLVNGLVSLIWGGDVKNFPSPFPLETTEVLGVTISVEDLGTLGVTFATLAVVTLFFRYTRIGLAMRATAVDSNTSQLMGINVKRMLAFGWGMAMVLGAVAGMMSAPQLSLDPNMMLGVLIYAFAAAVLGGLNSPIGVVVGGLVLGVALNLMGRYLEFLGTELQVPIALALLIAVLVIRPWGLFGRAPVRRV